MAVAVFVACVAHARVPDGEKVREAEAKTKAAIEAQNRAAGRAEAKKEGAATEAQRLAAELKEWPQGDVATLRQMAAEDIATIQILRLGPQRQIRNSDVLTTRYWAGRPLGDEETREKLEVLLTLIRRAGEAKKPEPRTSGIAHPPDRVLVVKPVAGEPFEIRYAAGLREPFGGLYSLELKEVLHVLSAGPSSLTIIHFHEDEVKRVIHTPAGGRSSTSEAEMRVTVDGISLYAKVREGGQTLAEDEKLMHYGEAKVYASEGPGSYIVLLHRL